MGSSVAYVEGIARKYAIAAAQAESKGDYETAATNLRRALEILEDLVRNHPDHPLSPTYRRLVAQYRQKLSNLEERMRAAPASGGEDEVYVEVKDDRAPPFVMKERPNITFNDIAGLDDVKAAIREAVVYPIKRPELFPLGWHRGILLYGPPGTGKTTLGIATANEAGAEFLLVDAADIMSKWLGEGEKNVKRLFSYARERAQQTPVIMFIDEVDALLGQHGVEVGGEARVRNQFLKEMGGVLDKTMKVHLYIIAATNKPWKLEEAFIRRFQKRLYVPLPNLEARKRLLELLTRRLRLSSSVDLGRLAEVLEGYSGSDIEDIVKDAYMRVVREVFARGGQGEPRPLEMSDFLEVIEKRKPSVDQAQIRRFEEWSARFGAL